MIRQTLLYATLLVHSQSAFADDHKSALHLEARQPAAVMNVTSVNLGTDASSISAEGKMGNYGKVYVTYRFLRHF